MKQCFGGTRIFVLRSQYFPWAHSKDLTREPVLRENLQNRKLSRSKHLRSSLSSIYCQIRMITPITFGDGTLE